MTPTQLEALGLAIYGEEWKSPMARDLGVSYRTVLRWKAGTFDPPAGILGDLRAIAKKRAREAIAQAKRLAKVAG